MIPEDLKNFEAETMRRRLAREIDAVVLISAVIGVALAWWYGW